MQDNKNIFTEPEKIMWPLLAVTVLPLLFWKALPLDGLVLHPSVFIPAHTLAEIIAVVVAALIYFTGMANPAARASARTIWLTHAFLAVGLLDLLHLLSYEGLPDLVTPNSPHKAIVFWLAARFVAASVLLAYVLMPPDTRAPYALRRWARGLAVACVLVVAWAALIQPGVLPPMFIPGQGLTHIKILAEWLIAGMNLAAAAILLWRRGRQAGSDVGNLLAALLLMATGELFFTLYTNVHDAANLVGHLYKAVAYYYLYRAMFVEIVRQPVIELRRSEQARAESEERMRHLIEHAPDAILIAEPGGRIEYANERLSAMLGYSPLDLARMSVEDLLPARFRTGHAQQRKGYMRAPTARPMGSGQTLYACRQDGSECPVDISLSNLEMAEGTRAVAFIRDVTERKQREDRMQYVATHDDLTGLPNRLQFRQRLEGVLARPMDEGGQGALILLDLDHFKNVNDSLSHEMGDLLLRELASRIGRHLPEGGLLARFSGDEFHMLLDGASRETAGQVAEDLLRELEAPFRIDGHELIQGASLGIAVYPEDGRDVSALLRHVDLAMYSAKSDGRNTYRFYSHDMSEKIRRKLDLQARLRRALERGEFSLHFQPQVDLASGGISGWEALLRWKCPEEGMISPAEFIPVAEESGLIVQMGEWVLREACSQFVRWRAMGLEPGTLAVNLSPREFRSQDLAANVARILDETGYPPKMLELEITESTIMEDVAAASQALTALHGMGIKLAVDDFGTGYSSLSYLRTFPLDHLKIDRSFVRNLAEDDNDGAIARTVIVLAHTLGLKVIAEGVETEAQLCYLYWNRCDEIQGYYFSRPLPPEECEAMLRAGRRLDIDFGLLPPLEAIPGPWNVDHYRTGAGTGSEG